MASSAATPKDLPPAMLDVATSIADWVVVWPIVLPMVGAAILLMLRNRTEWQAPFSFAILVATLLANFSLIQTVFTKGTLTMTMGNWLPPFGISFTADSLGALFALVSTVVMIVVLFFVQSEVEDRETKYGYHPLMLILLTGVSGAFLTGDLFNLYVWFEVMLIASFGLMVIGGRKIQLDAAIKYGFINFLATTFFLIGIAYIYGLVGTLNMADIMVKAPLVENGAIASVAALFFLAFAMKAAVFPVNSWLPASYHAPDPAVSALFAGLLTKVGIYGLLRVHLMLIPQSHAQLQIAFMVVAVLTLVLSPLGALAQTNARRALGFLVMGGIGAMLAGLAFGTPYGIAGASLYAVHSMLTMTALYLAVGLVERMGGTSDIRHLGGLYKASSPLSILFLILVFAAAGLPPFLGFWPKLTLLQAGISLTTQKDPLAVYHWWVIGALLLNSLLTSIAGSRLWAHIFWRNGREGKQSEIPNANIKPLDRRGFVWGLLPTMALVGIIVVVGLWPSLYIQAGFESAKSVTIFSPNYITSVFGENSQ
ncbi:proton-conducting transporter membrane subunit [Maritalea porphyrae]|uniref:proton-conducting transporter transmembrane domain-containing protein n=1 Tax=Maritalea porphyrae TaxID=880732 RepID=UPI0022AF0D77|nr:proton-conducting transporter membrane subunit [Maritalea porphyrae]MCZ4271183.1 proton-conducting transporter membrane subunit [Maritalea porphyrae]